MNKGKIQINILVLAVVLPLCQSLMAPSIESEPITLYWQLEDTEEPTNHAQVLTLALEMVVVWSSELDSPWRT